MTVYVQDITPPKYIRIGYELPYYASSAEIKIISIDAKRIIDSCTLPAEIREGEKNYILQMIFGEFMISACLSTVSYRNPIGSAYLIIEKTK